MKKSKSLSIIMAMMLATQGGGDSAVFAMKGKIQDNLLKILFFRPDLINTLKGFLQENLSDIPECCRSFEFLDYLNEKGFNVPDNHCFEKGDILLKSEKPIISENQSDSDEEFQEIDRRIEKENRYEKIISEDDIKSLRREFDINDKDARVRGQFIDDGIKEIPILHYCVIKNAIECFKFLVLSGADSTIKYRDFREHSAQVHDESNPYLDWDCMSLAAYLGKWEMMKILKEKGINESNNPAVWEAAALAHRNKLLKLLISEKDKIDNFKECLNKAIVGAAIGNNIKGIAILISNGANINAAEYNGIPLLHMAAKNDSLQASKISIGKGADINGRDNYGDTSLHYAASYGAHYVSELLISKGADVNARGGFGGTPLHCACGRGLYSIADLLISKGADVNSKDNKGITPLHYAYHYGKGFCNIADLLISKGADVNSKDNKGITPLHNAMAVEVSDSLNGDEPYSDNEPHYAQVINFLISKGAKINAKDIRGRTPLYYVIRCMGDKSANLLISKGADVNAKDNKGKTPLHYALQHYDEIAELLVRKGADVNARDNKGRTPLHYAVRYLCDSDLVELLISKGADVNAKDNEGMTPLGVGVAKIAAKEDEIGLIDHLVKLLISKGGRE